MTAFQPVRGRRRSPVAQTSDIQPEIRFRDVTRHHNYQKMQIVEILAPDQLGDARVMQLFLSGLPDEFAEAEDVVRFGPDRCIPWIGKKVRKAKQKYPKPILKISRGLILSTSFVFGAPIGENSSKLSPSASRISYWLFVNDLQKDWTTERLCGNHEDCCINPYHLQACCRGIPVKLEDLS